jgi:uncharacterized protein (TIGR03083 family)
MTGDARKWLRGLRKSHEDLVGRVARFDADRLREQSYCTDWTVAQVLSHLGSGAEISLETFQRALEGRPALDEFGPIWDRWNAMSPEEQATGMVEYDRRLMSALDGTSREEIQQLRISFSGMDLDAAGFIGMRLGEHALHRWDVVVTEDSSATLLPSSVELVVDRLPMLAGRAGKAAGAGGRRAIGIRTSDPERRYLLRVGDQVTLTDGTDDLRDGLLDMPAEALIRLVYGRLDPDHTPAGIKATGAADLDELRKVFPGL